jgi:hypothetical protein
MSSPAESNSATGENGQSGRRLVRILLGLGILLGIIIISVVVGGIAVTIFRKLYPSGADTQQINIFIGFITVTANTILSGILIFVYLNQNQTLKREADILESQQELTKAGMKPDMGHHMNLFFHLKTNHIQKDVY